MEYNTSRDSLIVPEYGRNIQQMIQHAITIEDKEERNKVAKAIVNVMCQIGYGMKGTEDFKQRIWDQLFLISNFKLDVDSPYPKPEPTRRFNKPEKIPYPTKDMRYKHYGKTVEGLIKYACTLDDGEEKIALVKSIANLMKRCYLNWNRDSVNDELIVKHLENLSNGKLVLPEGFQFVSTRDIVGTGVSSGPKKKFQGGPKHNNNNNRNNNNRSNNSNNKNRKRY
jgi:hypothetical protein